jgi:hypothetical protein
MYLPPPFSIAAFMAASSRFQRSSWKFDQDTPTTTLCAYAIVVAHRTTAVVRVDSTRLIFMVSPPVGGRRCDRTARNTTGVHALRLTPRARE